jgi:putative chitinase
MTTSNTGLQASVVLRASSGQATTQAHDAAHATQATQASAPAERSGPAPTLVSLAQLHAVMPNLPAAKASSYIGPLNRALVEFHIDNRLRICAFLGQVAHESGELAWFHEFASGMEYDITVNPRLARELGNVKPGDGPRYKGRGPIQLTGRNNYIACGKALGLDLVDNPDLAVQPGVAFRTAGWFWSTHGLNALADQGDYRTITRRINGGYNGWADRVKYYDRALAVFPATKA